MIKSLKDLLDKLSRFTNSLVYDGGICKRLKGVNKMVSYTQNELLSITDFTTLKQILSICTNIEISKFVQNHLLLYFY